ncbi:hypothetical protein V8C34DRAFT_297348 [Trichoderma compactum]
MLAVIIRWATICPAAIATTTTAITVNARKPAWIHGVDALISRNDRNLADTEASHAIIPPNASQVSLRYIVADVAAAAPRDYWVITDYDDGAFSDCEPSDAGYQKLSQPDDLDNKLDLPASWTFSKPLRFSITSCTWSATETAASASPTGTLICPDLGDAILCPPMLTQTLTPCDANKEF